MEGRAPLATKATLKGSCETLDGSDPSAIIEQSKKKCMVANSPRQGVPVSIV
jgi:organic hydroperoxide reductase OsmC/OhrA